MKWAFQSIATGKFLTVSKDQPYYPIYASASSVGEQETFEVELLTDKSSLCLIQAFNGLYLGYVPTGTIIGAWVNSDEAIQFVQLYTQSSQMSLVDAGLELTAGVVTVDTESTPANLIISLPLDTSDWPNQYSLFKVVSVSQ